MTFITYEIVDVFDSVNIRRGNSYKTNKLFGGGDSLQPFPSFIQNKNFTAANAITTDTWSKGTYIIRLKDKDGWKMSSFEKE